MYYFNFNITSHRNETEMIFHSKDPFAPVAYLRFPNISLADKVNNNQSENHDKL